MKEKITAFINNLIIYDYVLFGSILLLFILFIILAILLRKKLGLSIFLVLFSFIFLLVSPFVAYKQMHEYLFVNELVLTTQKRLKFTEAIVIKGTISNISKFKSIDCQITATTHKVTGNKMKDMLFQYLPFKTATISENNITKGEIREFKMFIEPFRYKKDYNLSIDSGCSLKK